MWSLVCLFFVDTPSLLQTFLHQSLQPSLVESERVGLPTDMKELHEKVLAAFRLVKRSILIVSLQAGLVNSTALWERKRHNVLSYQT